MSNDHKDHRQRVKQEFLSNGMEHFPPHKVLELVLFYCIPRKDTNVIAHRLIERFGSLSGVFDAPIEMLLESDGIGYECATYIKVLSSFIKRYMVDAYSSINTLNTVEQAKEYVRYRFLSDTVECVLLVCTGYNGKVIFSSPISKGTLERVDLTPADVIKTCLRVNAAKAILAHNHPGGFCNPSRKDINTTCILYDELARVDVELFDHIIVASDDICSMRENGMSPFQDTSYQNGWK